MINFDYYILPNVNKLSWTRTQLPKIGNILSRALAHFTGNYHRTILNKIIFDKWDYLSFKVISFYKPIEFNLIHCWAISISVSKVSSVSILFFLQFNYIFDIPWINWLLRFWVFEFYGSYGFEIISRLT